MSMVGNWAASVVFVHVLAVRYRSVNACPEAIFQPIEQVRVCLLYGILRRALLALFSRQLPQVAAGAVGRAHARPSSIPVL